MINEFLSLLKNSTQEIQRITTVSNTDTIRHAQGTDAKENRETDTDEDLIATQNKHALDAI